MPASSGAARPPRRFIRSVAFQDVDSALAFVNDLSVGMDATRASVGGSRRRSMLKFFDPLFSGMASRHGGSITVVRSSSMKEQEIYQYQETVYPEDRHYLATRDTTAKMIVEDVPRDLWYRPPRTYIREIDAFLDAMWDIGFGRAAHAAHIGAREDGGAFVVALGGGDPADPLPEGVLPRAWRTVYAKDIVPDSEVEDATGDPFLHAMPNHGLERIEVRREGRRPGDTGPDTFFIHGSRLVPFNQDVRSDWWCGRSLLDVLFDTLWNFRDVVFGHTRGIQQGNAIVADVDVAEGYHLDDTTTAEMQEEITEFREGGRDIFSPVEGVKLRRVGPADLGDPTMLARLLASNLAQATEFTANQFVSAGRAGEQADQNDQLVYVGKLHVLADAFERPIVAHLLRIGQRGNGVPRRLALPASGDIEWPDPIAMDPRNRSLAILTKTKAMQTALASGRLPPSSLDRMFPVNATKYDPELILPTVSAKVGDDTAPAAPPARPRGTRAISSKLPRTSDEFQRMLADVLGEPDDD